MSIKICISSFAKSCGSHCFWQGVNIIHARRGDHTSDTNQASDITDDNRMAVCNVRLASGSSVTPCGIRRGQEKWLREILFGELWTRTRWFCYRIRFIRGHDAKKNSNPPLFKLSGRGVSTFRGCEEVDGWVPGIHRCAVDIRKAKLKTFAACTHPCPQIQSNSSVLCSSQAWALRVSRFAAVHSRR